MAKIFKPIQSYDKENDIYYCKWSGAEYEYTEEPMPGIILDVDREDKIIGIEILNYKRRMKDGDS